MREIGIVTGARSDFGSLAPIMHQIDAMSGLDYRLYATGMHLSPAFGSTVEEIVRQGFRVDERIESLMASDSPQAISKSMGIGTVGFAQAFFAHRPDLLLVVGDRFETHAAVVAAIPFLIPVAHLHGGESTEGLIDELIRHSITKMSHLHFTSTEQYAGRLMRMGEEPWRVHISGAPVLDNLYATPLLERWELEERFDLKLETAPLLVTYHPVTLDYADTGRQIANLLRTLVEVDRPVIFTYPNADTESETIIRAIRDFTDAHPRSRLLVNMGYQAYLSLMKISAAMVGNSSSGILEAASFELPVVNIGNRQGGRLRTRNIVDVGYESEEIQQAICSVLRPEFREGLKGLVNPYGDGQAAQRVVESLLEVELGQKLLVKKFYQGAD